MSKRYLLDLNVLVALTNDEHEHYTKAIEWFGSLGNSEWAVCPLTEIGYIRLLMNPSVHLGGGNETDSAAALVSLCRQPGYRFWPVTEKWATLTAAFSRRIFGHQQVTDAYLLGMAIKEDGVLVTFDRGLKYMAGPEFARNLLVLE